MGRERATEPTFVHPFPGPCLMTTTVPDEVMAALRKVTGGVLAGRAPQVDWSHQLAGEISEGDQYLLFHFDPNTAQPGDEDWGGARELYLDFLRETAVAYATELVERGDHPRANMAWRRGHIAADPYDSWLVRSRAGDYNPLHDHGQFVSGVLYLKVPEQVNAETAPAGCIDFVDRTTSFPLMLNFNPTYRVVPVEGLVIVFPSWLQHAAHPFRGEGERHSVSFNLTLRPV
ncbi:MAG: putative 2OG-Fe(II) oxygenase [Acidobacteriota bacterium]